jgi:hypothetical protein
MRFGAALLWLKIEKHIIEQLMIDLFQQMMRTVRFGFISIGSDMHAVTACAWFRRGRKDNIEIAYANVTVAIVAFVGKGRLR